MKKLFPHCLKFGLYLFLLPLLLAVSCLKQEGEEAVPVDLFGKWSLVTIGYTDKADLPPPQDTHVWVEFSKERPTSGQHLAGDYTYWLNGQAAPNHYFGGFRTSGLGSEGSIRTGELATTEIASTRMMDTAFEREYFRLLPQAKSYTIQGNTLTVLCREGEKLVYNRQLPE
ncbi:META domain-containing protein [Pontibacter roseus]|uniref:META domain-containing protein n=1 Tax=Pontibacter roseus TaxID=336989 RepID=UPI00036C3048|nr:META domain-containing protein [Pontibacter roseus]